MTDSAQQPDPHPEPPVDLQSRDLPVIEIEAPWFRIHQTTYSPLYYGRSGRNRFDAPAREYGVLYVALDPHGCFIETFGSKTGIQIVSLSELSLRSISQLSCTCRLKLVDLTGAGLARIRADARLGAGDHRIAQRWARALWSHSIEVDGIYYRARHDPSQFCAAIFDRAEPVITITNTQGCASSGFAGTLAKILDTYQFGLVD
ncbi:MAG: hypothetical protein N4J56_007107 [Chroococcidiopsis sp. SAG 2025]|uniref:RES family NAD+ phosphorylase n=1 Tax=Chroococcidiopsis sp. SAG 2025 TaxID=171389 RepID=UPI0005854AC4|nr:RES family NAD+ phosphorylase [Chroococcidiopsis sp. SAG 2025]MDV2997402.1 hypothetical protein [Chroococcidiopsis sp. SAG 2025]